MTEEEKRIARNEASKRCRMKKLAEARKALPAAKRVEIIKAKPLGVMKTETGKKDTSARAMKPVDKLVKVYAKPVHAVKAMVKEAASILSDMYKTGDDTLIAKAEKTLFRELGLAVDHRTLEPQGRPKRIVALEGMSKVFSVPKSLVVQAELEENTSETDETETEPTEDEPETEDPVEIASDPDLVKALSEGTATEADVSTIMPDQNEDELSSAEDDEDDENKSLDDEDDDEDEDDMTPAERNAKRYRDEERLDADYASGRWATLSEQGFSDDE